MSCAFAFILVVNVSGAVPAPTSSPASVEVAVTVDDLPQHGPTIAGQTPLDLARRMARTLRAHAVPPVYGFVNASKADEDPSLVPVLTTWRDEGQVLGNHTYSHKSLDATALADYLADVTRDEALLARLEPTPAVWHVFRYPFLFEGKDLDKRRAVKRFLAEHGYRIAEVSIDADDWAFNPPFARCSALGKTSELARLRGDFVAAHVDELRRMRALGRQLTGGEIRHVLLLHLGVADVDALDALLTALEHEGARWVSLDRALDDPFYAGDPDIPFAGGAAFPYVVARARGVKVEPPIYARGLEQRLEQTCR